MVAARSYIRWFDEIQLDDVPLVGGKNASLGELYSRLSPEGIRVPNGFAITAAAYRDLLDQASAWQPLRDLLLDLDKGDVPELSRRAAAAREIVYAATDNAELREQARTAFERLRGQYGRNLVIAVRSSATAEDLPTASFAGQHDSFLNIRTFDALHEACRRCFASIFTDRAIAYRIDKGFDHFKVALSVGVMKMVRSDRGASGVIFTLDTESGFRDVILITGGYGLGETIVQGKIDPDEFYVHKPTFRRGHRTVLRRSLGQKQLRMTIRRAGGAPMTVNVPVAKRRRARFCIGDSEVLALAEHALKVEEHYSARAGHAVPMDIEWAWDGTVSQLYIVQARPETVASARQPGMLETYQIGGKARTLVTGRAVGDRIASGSIRTVSNQRDLAAFRPGEVLVADSTTPDWEPVMKTAAAIVTNRGGRTCHAAIIARELGVPAVVGASTATESLAAGQIVTVSCAEGDVGKVYEGEVPFSVTRLSAAEIPRPRTRIMVNLGNPDLAFRTAMLPSDGVGLARMEFIISEQIGIHPMALLFAERVSSARIRRKIEQMTRGYAGPADYFIQRLSEGVGTIAAAFYPEPVIVRLSDFKTNEYANLIGGKDFEPTEANPMIGFRGASRYTHPAYAPGFALECAAMIRVRNEMGLDNVKLMIPFCRRSDEARKVIDLMAAHGLRRGERGVEIYVMCEIPNNVMQIDAFAELFDGFSIGSNDLAQLTLGVDRDSEVVAFDFDERDPGVLEMIRLAVRGAKRNGRHIGICGEAPSDYPEIARFLVELGIDSLSLNPGSLLRTTRDVVEIERTLPGAPCAADGESGLRPCVEETKHAAG